MDYSEAIEKAREAIPARLKRLRGGLTQREAARRIGVYQQNLSRYEHGMEPGFGFLAQLYFAGVDLNAFVGGRGPLFRDGRARLDEELPGTRRRRPAA